MICPKCGRNIEGGGACPYCDAPEIDDNTDEYLKRKNAYESSLKQDERQDEPAAAHKFKKKHAISALIAIGAALVVAVVYTHLPRVYKGNVYALSEEGGVFKATTGGELEKQDGRIYPSDGRDTYSYWVKSSGVSYSAYTQGYCESPSGRYSALVQPEEGDTGNSCLYVWDDQSMMTAVFSDKASIYVKDVTDTGEVIFETSPVLNDQLYTGNTSLHIYKVTGRNADELTGEIKKISDSPKRYFIYEKAKSLICLEEDGTLFSCPDYDVQKRVIIAENVTKLLAEREDEDNFFSEDAYGINPHQNADMIAYLRDGIWTMTDTQGGVSLKLGAASETAGFIYDDSNRIVIRIEGNKLSRSIVSDSGLKEWTQVGEVGGSLIWDSIDGRLICEEKDGVIKRVGSNEESVVFEGAKDKSLRRIYNGSGYIFVSDAGVYYSPDFKAEPSLLTGEISGELHKCAKYKDRLYIYADDSLYVAEKNGNTALLCKCKGLYVVY